MLRNWCIFYPYIIITPRYVKYILRYLKRKPLLVILNILRFGTFPPHFWELIDPNLYLSTPQALYLLAPCIAGYSPSGRIRLAALQAHLGRHWRRQGRRRRREGAVDVAVPAEGRRRGGGARTGRVRGGWRRVGGVIGTAHPEGGGVVRHHVRRLLWVAVAAVHRRR